MNDSSPLRSLAPSRTQWFVGIGAGLLMLLAAFALERAAGPRAIKPDQPVVSNLPDKSPVVTPLPPEQAAKLVAQFNDLQTKVSTTSNDNRRLRAALAQPQLAAPKTAEFKSQLAAGELALKQHVASLQAVQSKLQSAGLDTLSASTGAAAEAPVFQLRYAAWLLGVVIGTALLISLGTLFIYLGSPDRDRAERAGKVFKTAFTFVVTTATGAAAYMGFGLKG